MAKWFLVVCGHLLLHRSIYFMFIPWGRRFVHALHYSFFHQLYLTKEYQRKFLKISLGVPRKCIDLYRWMVLWREQLCSPLKDHREFRKGYKIFLKIWLPYLHNVDMSPTLYRRWNCYKKKERSLFNFKKNSVCIESFPFTPGYGGGWNSVCLFLYLVYIIKIWKL